MKRSLYLFAALLPALAWTPETLAAIASDNAANSAYADGWQAGDNGGFGFLPWAFEYSGDPPTYHSDHFIDNAPLAANSLGAPAFGLTDSGRAYYYDTSTATRPFASSLAVGQSFEVDLDGAGFAGGDPNAYSKGNIFTLRNNSGGNSAAAERFGIFTSNGLNNDNWSATNPLGTGSSVDTGIPAGSAFHVLFKLTGAETYSLVLSPIGGGSPLFSQNGTLRTSNAGTLIDRASFTDYGTGSAADGSSELFFNRLGVVPEPSSLAILAAAAFGLGRRRRQR